MNYIGSKKTLINFIEAVVKNEIGNIKNLTFCDLFAGTGIVGRFFKDKVSRIISNDIEYYSYVLNKNYIENEDSLTCENLPLIEKEGFIYKNYCIGSGSNRMYFSDKNGKYIDGIRQYIEKEKNKNLFFLKLCSLLENADKVANTASVYGAFLKKIKRTALNKIDTNIHTPSYGNPGIVYQEDANILIKKISGDILYLDPPYNNRHYGSNYHILNTISKYDDFIPKGKTGLPEYFKSKYCYKDKALKIFDDLIKNANFKYILFSYNNEGIMNLELVKNVMSKYGKYKAFTKKYKRFKADNREYISNETTEFIHLLIKE